MNNIFETKISYYNNVKDKVGTEISLGDFLFCDKYKEQIENLRAIKDENMQKCLKKQLPLSTISGLFAPIRKAECLVKHSKLLCVDIDKKDNMDVGWFDDLKNEWCNIPQILYAAHSVRGLGWFVIFRIAYPEKHKAQFEALHRDFAHEGLKIDSSCKDVCRMRTISYDPDPYVNEHASLYYKLWEESRPTCCISYTDDDDIERAKRCCQEIDRRGIDITSSYDDWIRIGAALATLGESGRSLFHLVSSQNCKYKFVETDKKFDSLHSVTNITIGTFFYICSKYGISWK